MSFEIEGTLHKIYESENKSGKFVTREFVLQITSGNYPEYPKFQLVQDRVGLVDQFAEGDTVKVKLLGFDNRGKVRLSMKQVDQQTGEDLSKKMAEGEGSSEEQPAAQAE